MMHLLSLVLLAFTPAVTALGFARWDRPDPEQRQIDQLARKNRHA